MNEPTRPERIKRMRDRMAEIERNLIRFRDGLRDTNDERHHRYLEPLLTRLDLIVRNEKEGITIHLANDLVAARTALRRLPLPDIDPDLDAPTQALEVLRGHRGNLIEALDNALEAAEAIDQGPTLSEFGAVSVPRDQFANALIRLDERLRIVQDSVAELAAAAAQADLRRNNNAVSQTGLFNMHVKSMTVEVSAARFETRIGDSPEIPAISDLGVLSRATGDMREIAGDIRELVNGLGTVIADGVKPIARLIVSATERSWRGVRTVVRIARRRLVRPQIQDTPVPTDEANRASDPLAWAAAQHERGDRLYEEGKDLPDSTTLQQAIAAYRAALEGHTRDRVPLAWAATQNNLGAALQTLGARESGTARLEEAVTAYRAALEERTRDRVPLDWAMTQSNLGTALQTLGARESGTARLEEAVTAFRAALEERTRDRVPLDWAMTQNNLGTALSTLGARESGTPASAGAGKLRLEEAVIAFRAALEERTRDRVPLDWAFSQHNLSNTLSLLAERTRDRAMLVEALGRMRDAAEVYREGRNSHWLPIAEQRIAEIEAALAAWPAP